RWNFSDTIHGEMSGQIIVTDKNVNIEIQGYTIRPQQYTVQTGSTVTWSNRDLMVHTVTAQTAADGTPIYDQNGQPILDSSGACIVQPPGSPSSDPSSDPSSARHPSTNPSDTPSADAGTPYSSRPIEHMLAFLFGDV